MIVEGVMNFQVPSIDTSSLRHVLKTVHCLSPLIYSLQEEQQRVAAALVAVGMTYCYHRFLLIVLYIHCRTGCVIQAMSIGQRPITISEIVSSLEDAISSGKEDIQIWERLLFVPQAAILPTWMLHCFGVLVGTLPLLS
jgi:hypothetical protein